MQASPPPLSSIVLHTFCLLVSPSISLSFTPSLSLLPSEIQFVRADSLLCRTTEKRNKEGDGKHCRQKPLTRISSTLARLPWFDHREQRQGKKEGEDRGEITDRIPPQNSLCSVFFYPAKFDSGDGTYEIIIF